MRQLLAWVLSSLMPLALSARPCQGPKAADLESSKLSATKFCLGEKPFSMRSPGCMGDLSCRLLKPNPQLALPRVGEVGNPGYRLCRNLNAEPHMFRLRFAGRWENHTVCLDRDGEFVDLEVLYRAHLR